MGAVTVIPCIAYATLQSSCMIFQTHKLHDNIHDIDLSTMDAKTVGEVRIQYPIRRYFRAHAPYM